MVKQWKPEKFVQWPQDTADETPPQTGRNIYILQRRQRLSRSPHPLPLRTRDSPRSAPYPPTKRIYYLPPPLPGG